MLEVVFNVTSRTVQFQDTWDVQFKRVWYSTGKAWKRWLAKITSMKITICLSFATNTESKEVFLTAKVVKACFRLTEKWKSLWLTSKRNLSNKELLRERSTWWLSSKEKTTWRRFKTSKIWWKKSLWHHLKEGKWNWRKSTRISERIGRVASRRKGEVDWLQGLQSRASLYNQLWKRDLNLPDQRSLQRVLHCGVKIKFWLKLKLPSQCVQGTRKLFRDLLQNLYKRKTKEVV